MESNPDHTNAKPRESIKAYNRRMQKIYWCDEHGIRINNNLGFCCKETGWVDTYENKKMPDSRVGYFKDARD